MGAARLVLLAGAMLFASLVWDIAVLDRVIIAVLVVLFISWVLNTISLTGLGFERTLHLDRINVGDVVAESMILSNRSRIPKLWIELSDHSSLPNAGEQHVVSLGGKRSRQWEHETVAIRRGRFRLGPLRIRASDPLGLFRSETTIPLVHNVVVFPAQIDVSRIPLPTASLTGGTTAHRTTMVSSPTVSSVRDYAPGDAMNRIAWSATARRGQLMVKEFDPDPTADIWLVLDLAEGSHTHLTRRDSVGGVARFLDSTTEYTVSIAASLAHQALQRGRQVGLLVNSDPPVRVESDNAERQWFRIAETLAMVKPGGDRSLADLLTSNHRRFSRTSGVIIVSANPAGTWIPAAASLVERLVPVTAVIVDAGSDAAKPVDTVIERLVASRISTHRYATNGGGTV